MANLSETATYEAGIYQIKTTDPVEGGVEGISNRQARQLANRTTWLKQSIETVQAANVGKKGVISAVTLSSLQAWSDLPVGWTGTVGKASSGLPDSTHDFVFAKQSRTAVTGNGWTGLLTRIDQAVIYFGRSLSGEGIVWAKVAMAGDGVPVGTIIALPGSTLPGGYLECDGSALSRTSYAALFGVIGVVYNQTADAADKFRLPDLRGEFIRGWDHGRNVDKDRAIGSSQKATRVYRHNYYPDGWRNSMYGRDHLASADIDGPIEAISAGTTNRSKSAEINVTDGKLDGVRVRPRNVALMYAIRY